MLILLPPSEGKATPSTGSALDLANLSMPELNPARNRVAQALVKLCEGRPARAQRVLGLSTLQDSELERDRRLLTAPAARAVEVYTGVVYDSLGYPTLPPAAQHRLDEWVVIASALWGAVRLTDHIPAYRCSADVTLPRVGPLGTFWRKPLATAIPEAAGSSGVVFDLRSGGYAKMWSPSAELTERTVVGRVLQRRPDGSTKVVSHHNKATKGRLVRALAKQRKAPESVSGLAEIVESLGFSANLVAPAANKPAQLDIVVDELASVQRSRTGGTSR